MTRILLKALILFSTFHVSANNVFTSFPATIEPGSKYVFYSHGYIVEGDDPKPVHKSWGLYDFPLIKETLARLDVNLIAYHRKEKTNPFEFSKQLARDAETLIASGVKPHDITFVGFSRGGAITALTSNELKRDDINFILLAACAGLVKSQTNLQVYGNVRSIIETTDEVGSCQFLIDQSPNVQSYQELEITTGKSHGAFYLPRQEWIKPVAQWLK